LLTRVFARRAAEADVDGGADSEAEPPSGLDGDAEMDEADTAAGAASALANGADAPAVDNAGPRGAADAAGAKPEPMAADAPGAAAAAPGDSGDAAAVPDDVRRGMLNHLLGVPTAGPEGTGGSELPGAGGTDPKHTVEPVTIARETTPQRRPSLTAEAAAAAAEAAADSDDREDEEATPGPQARLFRPVSLSSHPLHPCCCSVVLSPLNARLSARTQGAAGWLRSRLCIHRRCLRWRRRLRRQGRLGLWPRSASPR